MAGSRYRLPTLILLCKRHRFYSAQRLEHAPAFALEATSKKIAMQIPQLSSALRKQAKNLVDQRGSTNDESEACDSASFFWEKKAWERKLLFYRRKEKRSSNISILCVSSYVVCYS